MSGFFGCGCKGGTSSCPTGKSDSRVSVLVLDLLELFFTIGIVMIILAIFTNQIYSGIEELGVSIKNGTSDSIDLTTSKYTSKFFLVFGFIITFSGLIAYMYKSQYKKIET